MRKPFSIALPVAVVLLAIVLAGCGTATPTTAPTTAPTSAPPTSSATSSQADWHSVGPTAGLADAVSLDVAAWFKDRWLVFGQTNDGPAGWWSTDGIAWQRADIRGAGSASTPVTINAIASNGQVAVAVGQWKEHTSGGSVDLPIADSGSATGAISFAVGRGEAPWAIPAATCEGLAGADAAVLTTTDGATWTQVPDSAVLRGQPMLGVVARSGGFVAAGGADGSGRSATWTSPDGLRWSRGPDSSALHAGWISDIATLGDAVIAVGGSTCGNLGGVPRAWRSADGRSWSLASRLIPVSCCGAAEHVAVAGTLAVADGSASTQNGGEPGSATWTSGDGARWTLHAQKGQEDLSWIGRIVATTDGFLATREGVWASTDGVIWTPVVSRDLNFGAVAVGPNGALAVGVPDIWAGPATVATH